jgi:alanyl-tRNA synthetase
LRIINPSVILSLTELIHIKTSSGVCMAKKLTGAEIRQSFIDFFEELGHTYVPSSSLVPGGDATLLFTNAGMVQFKDVFLGTDIRSYTRAANTQKCMRVAGKHNDLEDVGRDDTHHTFFEMLGNWSFGDYYKKEAIEWAWMLLTEEWGLPKEHLWVTCFEDELSEIPTDNEAAEYWRDQPGFDPNHVFFFGRKDNFWEMADTGPCGPNSEIHIDLQPELGPVNKDDLDTERFIELWNLVFIQYNRIGRTTLEPLPATHVDTGMGFERVVAVLQGVDSTYRTDLLWPLIQTTQKISGQNDAEREANFTPYRVIADHARAASFLIADGVVPGNLGRNYVTRMIIRRAFRFGGKIGLIKPFLSNVAEKVIEIYGDVYPELARNKASILTYITREEEQFQRTLDRATIQLENLLDDLKTKGENILPGNKAADLYTTYGMPLEITRDIAQEIGLDVDEKGFYQAMDSHRMISGGGKVMGEMGGDNIIIYREIRAKLQDQGNLPADGVAYDPHTTLEVEVPVLSLITQDNSNDTAHTGDRVEVVLPETSFYIEAGGQVSDTGKITSRGGDWEIRIDKVHKPVAGLIVHVGEVIKGSPKINDLAIASVDAQRRRDIMRNHTATHLLHAELRSVLGEHARQAGSLVAPDRLRFDFTHPEAVTPDQLSQIEAGINRHILDNYQLNITYKPLQQAIKEGAIALFGEKYDETVRTITIGRTEPFSFELCGGTHVENTGDVGICLITSEGSVASGIRRIEAVTGRGAYNLIQRRFQELNQTASLMGTSPDQTTIKTQALINELSDTQKRLILTRKNLVSAEFNRVMDDTVTTLGVKVLTISFSDADMDSLRHMVDTFRERNPENGVAVLANVENGRPTLIAAVTKDLTERGLHAGELVKFIAEQLGGSGGGKPTMAQAGGKDASKLDEALSSVKTWVEDKLKGE